MLQAEQHGTGHAMAQAMPQVPDDHLVLVLYGDVPLVQLETLARLVAEAGEKSIAILSVMLPDPTGYGRIVRDGAGNVVRIVEHKDANTKERAIHECNTGLMCVPAGRLRQWLAQLKNDNAQGEYYLTDVIVAAVRSGLKVNAVIAPTATEVLGVNDKRQLAELEAAYRERRATELMLAGVTLVDPTRFDARGPVKVGRDVFIDVNVVLEGAVTLGNRVHIGPNVLIRDADIGDDTVIHANCVIERASVGPRCLVGPFARLRPDALLREDVHVGNFVEVKKSELKRGAKANHLTYLGDATIGEKVNVGAGTITCNYDGANKWRTEIGARRVHRLGHDAGRAGEGRRRRHDRRGIDDHQGHARRPAHARTREAGHDRGLETSARRRSSGRSPASKDALLPRGRRRVHWGAAPICFQPFCETGRGGHGPGRDYNVASIRRPARPDVPE